MSKLELWIKTEKYADFSQVLGLPIMQEALAILQEDAMAHPKAGTAIVNAASTQEAMMRVTAMHFTQAGISQAIEKLRTLGKPMSVVERPQPKEPFEHIKPDEIWPNA